MSFSAAAAPLLGRAPLSPRPKQAEPAAAARATWSELRVLLLLALPTIVTSAAQQVIIVTSQAFAGHAAGPGSDGTGEMAAAALSNTFWSLLWYVLVGAATALDTLGSQAYGAGDKGGLVVWTIAATASLTVLNAPMLVGLWYGGRVAELFFGQGPVVAAIVSRYCRAVLPGLVPMTLALVLQKYLQAQGAVNAPAVVSCVIMVFNVAATVVSTRWGLQGIALAATATRLLLFVLMAVSVAVHEGLQRRQGPSTGGWWHGVWALASKALQPHVMWTFLSLSIPGSCGLMLGLECASFEVTTAFAGFLGPASVAAHAGLFSITTLCYIALPFALATAATIRVGNLLGASKAALAATTAWLVIVLGGTFMALCGLGIFFGRKTLGSLFTEGDDKVAAAIVIIAPLGALYQVGDGVLGTSQGVLRALGRQHQLMLLNMVAFWLIAVPLGFWLTFHAGGGGLGLVGLWIGMATGCFLAASSSCTLVWMVDWHAEERKALELLAAAHGSSGNAYAAIADGEGADAIVQVEEP